MKKILIGMLLAVAFANAQIPQTSVLGNWTMEPGKVALNDNLTLESSVFNVTRDWKYAETAVYSVHFPEFKTGKEKIDLKYKLQVVVAKEDYRIEGSGIKKWLSKAYETEISDASDEELAQTSLKDVDRLLKALVREFIPVVSFTDTELELQVAGGKLIKYTKPNNLPTSKLTAKLVPFFPPRGWRYPESPKELDEYDVRSKSKDITLMTMAEADFNGDGIKDAVAYLLNEETKRVSLFLSLSQPDGSNLVAPYGATDRNTVIENGVILAPAGEYTNISTKQKFTIERDGFMVVIFDSDATLHYMDSRGNWQTAPLGKQKF